VVQFEGRESFNYEPVESNPRKVETAFRHALSNSSKLISSHQVIAMFDADTFPRSESHVSFPFTLEMDASVKKPPSFNMNQQKIPVAEGSSEFKGKQTSINIDR
jgi:hypothetical protein